MIKLADLTQKELNSIGITAGLVTLLIAIYYGTGIYIHLKEIKNLNEKSFDKE